MRLFGTKWAFIRIFLLLLDTCSSSQIDHEQLQDTVSDYEQLKDATSDYDALYQTVRTENDIPVDTLGDNEQEFQPSDVQSPEQNDTEPSVATEKTLEKLPEYQRPICEKGKGCNKPLECFDFSSLGKDSPVPDPPRTVKVTPRELESILENKLYENCCAIVMFYAPWCEFSTQFARRFNALGRTFSELPVLAVDLGENEPHKYILAYLPAVVFYHRAKVIYKFDLSESYEELSFVIANMTDFIAIEVDLEDEENEYPVPTVRSGEDRLVLQLAVCWLVFVVAVLVIRSGPVQNCLEWIRRKLKRTKTE